MINRGDRYLLMGFSAFAFIFMAGSRSNCRAQPATLDCSSALNVTAFRGTCATFDNSCADHQWVAGDNFELDTTPVGVTVQTTVGTTIERTLCVSPSSQIVANQPLSFTYSRAGEYGEGTLYITTGVPLAVTVSASPSQILMPGSSVQLSANATGGRPPYAFSWTPAGSLSPSGSVQDPTASPANTTTYTVIVTDAEGSVAANTIQIVVDPVVSITASPNMVDAGQPSQLTTTVFGGMLPYTFSWSPADGLDDPTAQNPIARPLVSTTYNVVVTDAQGQVSSGSVSITVNLAVVVSATPTSVDPGSASQLYALASGGTPPYVYSWTPATGLSATDIANPLATPSVTTTYTVQVTDALGANAMGTVAVNVTMPAGPTACFTLTWVTSNRIQADASCSTGNIATYSWNESWHGDPNQRFDRVLTTPILSWFADPGATVRLVVTDTAGLTAAATAVIPPH
jgi:hypothetical protein